MIEVLISYIYIAVICLCIGHGVMKLIGRRLGIGHISLTGHIVCGIISLTVLAGWASLFTRIGVAVGIAVFLLAAASAYFARNDIRAELGKLKSELSYADLIVAAAVTLLIAYAASRGDFHTDTGIYHAAAIRLYEEYGYVRGIANLQLHYGYNSSYLGFASLFTFSRILPNALHTTTGFLMTLFVLDGLFHIRDFRSHAAHYADAARLAVILYVFMNLTGTMSPATDYGTMLMTGYFLSAWLGNAEGDDDTGIYALLSVYAIFLVTMKLSAAMCVLVVFLPLVRLIRDRAFAGIAGFIGLGLFSFLFYPIRNVLLSGWLFYPFEGIDLFNLEWKVPVQYSLVDSAQIKVWGRCLYDVDKVDWPISQWFPIWWEAQEHYDQMLIYGFVIGLVLIALAVICRRKIRPAFFIFMIMVMANLAVWFVEAPFIRYGLMFILVIPLMGLAGVCEIMQTNGIKLMKYVSVGLGVLIMICFAARIDHYMMDDLVFIKHHLAEPYYLVQKPFDNAEMGVEYMGEAGIPVYYTVNDREMNSYYTPPSTCYHFMLERTIPLGDEVRDGFRPR